MGPNDNLPILATDELPVANLLLSLSAGPNMQMLAEKDNSKADIAHPN